MNGPPVEFDPCIARSAPTFEVGVLGWRSQRTALLCVWDGQVAAWRERFDAFDDTPCRTSSDPGLVAFACEELRAAARSTPSPAMHSGPDEATLYVIFRNTTIVESGPLRRRIDGGAATGDELDDWEHAWAHRLATIRWALPADADRLQCPMRNLTHGSWTHVVR